MKLLLDTQILIWNAREPHRLAPRCLQLINDPANDLFFSAVSIWEIAIKQSLNKPGFDIKANVIRRGLLRNQYQEIGLSGLHAVAVESLPLLHADPFDRILIAQAITEGLTLLTSDRRLAQYPGPILKV